MGLDLQNVVKKVFHCHFEGTFGRVTSNRIGNGGYMIFQSHIFVSCVFITVPKPGYEMLLLTYNLEFELNDIINYKLCGAVLA